MMPAAAGPWLKLTAVHKYDQTARLNNLNPSHNLEPKGRKRKCDADVPISGGHS
jgi:hypothetical protein